MSFRRISVGRLYHSQSRSSRRETPVANLWLCPWHGTRVDVRWPEMPTSHLSDELTVVRQVRRSEAVQRLVHEHRQSEVESLVFTGSQWSCLSTGVMWSRRRAPVTSRATAFCTDCSRWIRPLEMSYSSALQ